MRRAITVLTSTALLILGVAPPAAASEVFPPAVAEAIPGLPCVPQCTLCHATLAGGIADKPFAKNLKAASQVLPREVEQLKTALTALQTKGAMSDADQDGIGDYTELTTGADPNSTNASATLCTGGPVYGCEASTPARTAPPGETSPWLWVAGAVTIVGLRARHRRLK